MLHETPLAPSRLRPARAAARRHRAAELPAHLGLRLDLGRADRPGAEVVGLGREPGLPAVAVGAAPLRLELRLPQELGGGRVELRAADISNNPYLGGAMVLAAGLEGIREKIDPGAPHTENMYLKSEEELKSLGVSYLPRTLEEAIDAFAADPLSREVMGDLMFETYVDFKRQEWEQYHNHVSDWEVQRYLKFY